MDTVLRSQSTHRQLIDRHNRKAHEVVGQDGETITVKTAANPKPPTVEFNEIFHELKESFYEKMKRDISYYINQASKIPPNKVRDNHLKMILSGFNVKQYKKMGAKVLSDDSLLSVYDNIRNELYYTWKPQIKKRLS